MYQINNDKLQNRPELRVGDRVYCIDNRLSVFRFISKGLTGGGENEMEVVIGGALGRDVYEEILAQDLPYGVMQEIVIIILAAIWDLEVEEAKRRFCHG